MSRQPTARQSARDIRRQYCNPYELVSADELLASLLGSAAVGADALPHGDPLLAGAYAVLDRELEHVWYDASLPPSTRRFSLAHELAHWFIHDSQGPCGEEEIDAGSLDDGSGFPFGEAYVQGYSRAQRRETEANAFATELLAPRSAVREAFENGMLPRDIADRIGVSESTVLGQLAELLLPDPPEQAPEQRTPEDSLSRLDPSQRAAATVDLGPTLVVAGPGTGKTRTLVARIGFLLQRGVAPHQILALTFSNRAANEMRQRMAETAPVAAQKIWIGTFHAFGLEVLKRFGTRIGLPSVPRVLDPLDAITLMERHLAEIDLQEYEFLHDPIFPLGDLLGAISRAKDELKSPADFADHAAQLGNEDEQARKAMEVARVYAQWQIILQREGLLDFGDLLYRSVEVIHRCSDVREQLRREYPHILVDEYQDINRASAVLVRELAGEGEGLWLVGDLRQAIYRFRGAAPSNLSSFEEDYPGGHRITLDVNYRSRDALVRLFSEVARRIGQPVEGGWRTNRNDPPRRASGGEPTADDELPAIVFGEADDDVAQADHIVSYVRRFAEHGYSLSDQAILCRTNRQAERLGDLLEAKGIPTVQPESLAQLLASPEAKDVLALLSLVSEGTCASLLALRRVARFRQYQLSDEEVRRITAEMDHPERPSLMSVLSASPEEGARRLHTHLYPIAYADAGSGQAAYVFLARYLFGPGEYLRPAKDGPPPATDSPAYRTELRRRRRIYRLLALARTFHPLDAEDAMRAFLAQVRRLIATGEGGRTAGAAEEEQIAEEGVRLVTAHGAKGLEFPIVFVPNLCEGMFPPRSRGGMVQLPPGVVAEETSADHEADEEARLFFVALTRARDHLVLSFPHRVSVAGRQKSSERSRSMRPSSLLSLVREPLTQAGATVEHWRAIAPVPEQDPSSVVRRPSSVVRPSDPIPLHEVETYLRCPRQYYYRYVERVPEPANESGYRAFARAARSLVQWRRAGRKPESAEKPLEEIWNESGLAEHPHAPLFRRRLEAIRNRLALLDSEQADEWQAELEAGTIALRPDGEAPGVVERHHLGRESDSHRTAPLLSLYRLAARQRGMGEVQVVNRYLASGETQEAPASPRYEPARLSKYDGALQGIQSGDFDPSPAEPNECNRCPFFLVCPL